MSHSFASRVVLGALLAILLLAFVVRFANIENIPVGLYPDEAANGVDALQALASGDFKLFYPANFGREGLFINIQAFFISFIGNTVTGLKFASILFGTLAVWGIYLLGRELFQRKGAGLIAAFMLATSYWAINFSRIGFRAIMTTFLLTFSFYFLFRGLRTHKWRDFLLSGLIFGLGLHTYIAFRVAPLILVLLLPVLMLSYEKFLKRFWKHGLVFALGAFITAAPMLSYFFITNPEDFASRSSHISIFAPEINKGDILGTLSKTFSLSLIKYNFWGDQNWRHNYAPYPVLDPFVGTFFLAGFLAVLWRTVTLIGLRLRENDRDLRLVRYTFLLASFFVMLIPEFLTDEGLPHALRSIGTQMPVFLMATIPAFWLYEKARRSLPGTKLALVSLLICTLGLSAVFNLTKYFVFFPNNIHASRAFNENYRSMARYLLLLPDTTRKYVLIDEKGRNNLSDLPIFAHPVVFLTDQKVQNMEIIQESTTIRRNSILLMLNWNQDLAGKILKMYPGSTIEPIDMSSDREGGEFKVILIPELTAKK